jgi:hypothetical protein
VRSRSIQGARSNLTWLAADAIASKDNSAAVATGDIIRNECTINAHG